MRFFIVCLQIEFIACTSIVDTLFAKLFFTECDSKTEVFLVSLLFEELRLIRFEIEEMQKLACDEKVCLMYQPIIEQSEIVENNCKDVVQTMSDLMEPLRDFIDGFRAFGDGIAL